MNVLMLSLTGNMLSNGLADVAERHQEYARRAGARLFVVGFNREGQIAASQIDQSLFVFPVNSSSHATFLFKAIWIASLLCKKYRFDVIYTQDPFLTGLIGVILKKCFRIPLIIGNHSSFINNSFWIFERPVIFRILNHLAKKVLPWADYFRVVNPGERERYIEDLNLPKDRIRIVPVPTPFHRFEQRVTPERLYNLKNQLGVKPTDKIILWVGRPVRVKRLPILFTAFSTVCRKVPEAKLILIGNKNEQQEDLDNLLNQQELNNDKVIWIKQGLKHEELPEYYQLSDLFVLCSRYEGFGNVLAEAAASSLPVVATDTAGASFIVENGKTGFLVPVDDNKALAEKIIFLLQNISAAKVMGKNAKQQVKKKFAYDVCMDEIIGLWREAINSGLSNCRHSR
jgi:glycosyltransferase involved in cell wall biosynthesis